FEPKFRKLLGEQARQVKKAVGVAAAEPEPAKPGARGAAKPAADFALRRVGRWLVYADAPFKLKSLRGEEGEPSLADSARFHAVRNRFTNDSLFVYVDTDVAQRGWALQMQQMAERQPADTPTVGIDSAPPAGDTPGEVAVVAPVKMPTPPAGAPAPEQTPTPEDAGPTPEESGEDPPTEAEIKARLAEVEGNLKEAPTPPEPTAEEKAVRGLSGVMGNLWSGVPRIPGAVALGVGLDRGALAIRLAVENTPDGTIALIPFLPNLVSGAPVTADSAAVAPDDAELFLAGSLDWTHVYNSTLGAASVNTAALMGASGEEGEGKAAPQPSADETIAAVEKLFGFKFKEDLLPSLGNEVGFSMPLDANDFGIGPRGGGGVPAEKKEEKERDAVPGPLVYVSLNDTAKMREILPRVLVAFGFAPFGASQGASEKREGVEIRTLGASDGFAYAFVDDYLVLGELKSVRHCADSFSKRQTLAASNAYRDATSWQAKQKLFHLYVSDAIARRVVGDTTKRSGGSTDPVVRALITQLEAAEYAPAAYEATNEGDLVMHEMRLPLSLVRSYALSVTVTARDAPVLLGETMAGSTLQRIAAAEAAYKEEKENGRFGTLEELIAAELLEKTFLEHVDYAVELKVSADKFEATATPKNYGKTGRRSFYLDETGTLRAADRKGQPATPDDPKSEQ
ncbi:MAG TPA: hypothetical protein VF508_11700, partial [Pyrinomonadaceae bacterium]